MADKVTGFIGSDAVEFENAATEATLKDLLKEMRKLTDETGGGGGVSGLIERVFDPESVKKANSGLGLLGGAARLAGTAVGFLVTASTALGTSFEKVIGFADSLANNGGEASKVLGSLSFLPFGIGAVASGLSMLEKLLEEQLYAYQKLTAAGANLGGNLDMMRLTAGRLNLTLDQFASLVAANGENLVKFGGATNSGLKAFINISNELNNGPFGSGLRGLGYTSEQINQSLMTYIALTGGRTKEELRNTRQLSAETANYLLELDRLAQITGKNREELEKEHEAAMQEATFQLWLAQQTPEVQKAAQESLMRAQALAGKAGEDIMKAHFMGVAVQGQAGRMYAAVASQGADMLRRDYEIRRRGGDQTRALQENEVAFRVANAEALRRVPSSVAQFNDGFKDLDTAVRQGALDLRQFNGDERKIRENGLGVIASQQDAQRSQASAQADQQVQMLKLGNQVMGMLLDLAHAFAPVKQMFIDGVIWVIQKIAANKELIIDVITTLVGGLKKFVNWVQENQPFLERLGSVVSTIGSTMWTAFKWLMDNPLIFTILGGTILGAIGAFKALQLVGTVRDTISAARGRPGSTVPGAPAPAPGGAAGGGGFLAGLGAQFNAAAGWLFKGLAIGASLAAIGWGITKLGEGMQAFSGDKVDWSGLGKAATTLTVLTAGMAGLGRLLAGPTAGYFAIGTAAIAALGAALQLFPVDILDGLGRLFDSVGNTIGGLIKTVFDGVANVFERMGRAASMVADSVMRIADLSWQNIRNVGQSLNEVSNAAEKFGDLEEETLKSISAVVGSLSILGNINAANLSGVNTGFAALFETMKTLDASKLASLGNAFEPMSKNLDSISKIKPANIILLTTFVNTMVAANFGKDGIIIFTEQTVSLMTRFSNLLLKPNIDQIERLKNIAIREMPSATQRINEFTNGLNRLLSADVAKIRELATAITELKTAMTLGPNEDTSVIENAIQRIMPQTAGSTATPGSREAAETGPFALNADNIAGNTNQLLEQGFESLNNNMVRLLNISSQISDNTYRTANKIQGGDAYRR